MKPQPEPSTQEVLEALAESSLACSRRHGGDAKFLRLFQRFGVLSMDKGMSGVRGYVRDAEPFRDHAGEGLL
jgi:hypothetical protein